MGMCCIISLCYEVEVRYLFHEREVKLCEMHQERLNAFTALLSESLLALI